MSALFIFSTDDKKNIDKIFLNYPPEHKRSAVMPLLTLAQKSNGGWLSESAIESVANLLEIPVIRVLEIATFYSMYQLRPVEKNVIKICTTTPCWLRGSDQLVIQCKEQLGLNLNESKEGISLQEVECLGACVNAPLVQLNDDYIENLDTQKFQQLLEKIASKKLSSGDSK
jgi:NADH-quinone oxidoreductase E subunit